MLRSLPLRLLLVVVLVGAAAGGIAALVGDDEDPQRVNQLAEAPLWVDPASGAAAWAREAPDDPAAAVLADTPAGIWLTPEQYDVTAVGGRVAAIAKAADAAGRVPLLVVYGIPRRDCAGGLSGGGTTLDAYVPWTRAIATAAGAAERAVVVLEPDALATASACGLRDERVRLIRAAVGALAAAGVTTYVDAGHSSWVPADEMAALLDAVGVERVRGFATNVANFQTTPAEIAYAEQLRSALPDAHYVIDTGRNGRGATGEWCNPVGRALGARPGFVDDGSELDALLWVKPPGESDGPCGGGPAAGTLWKERAEELVAAAS